ncbi:hypothetical protein TUM20985_45990 [Mycobacterium antarcticum]|uniref:hypothetical protein n=1 Tax=unclassified Mycolicibacterium TaxID=2636767 RepID=UPI00239DC413|nr:MULTISPECIES: hypothetical protein [unclassified Mycolicibacterium]BDX34052.1 hypothetical protein TUM20985_45990 [Mycolicibacterium sp. TUM20985]GLP77231.1 hypothetical protein TUM20983_43410 [Mycolicibacterium sp. TUM20983]GLP82353.1 hypothetical protein TUM20984_37730 [Mycolicibacterium sp. TUM20984]
MSFTVEDGMTRCPRCTELLVFRLDAMPGGGLRYDVFCPPCGETHFAMSTLPMRLPAAA